MTFPFPALAIRGQGVAWTPGSGSTRHGATIDSLPSNLANVPNSSAREWYDLDNTVEDTDGYLTVASGAGEIEAAVKGLKVPVGLAGLYVCNLFASIIMNPSTSTNWRLAMVNDSRLSGTYAAQIQAQAGYVGYYSSDGNNTTFEGAATVTRVLQLEEGDFIGWWISQQSGFVATFYYASLSIYRLFA